LNNKANRLGKKELEVYRKRLLEIRSKITGDVSRLEKDALLNTRDASGDLSGYSLHMADVATDNFDQELNLGLASTEQQLVNRVDAALKRVEDGSYGFSIKSGKPISKKRLEAVPYAELTIEEQKEEEKKSHLRS
jgi:RNA polymerase-binding protein DksA